MSGSAGLSAARRRRGVVPDTKPGSLPQGNQSILQQKQEPRAPINIGNLLLEHDKKLFDMEKKFSLIQETLMTKGSLDGIQQTNNVSGAMTNKLAENEMEIAKLKQSIPTMTKQIVNGEMTNKLAENKMEIGKFKQSIQVMTKQIQELNSLVENLKETILQQSEETNQIKRDISQHTEQFKNLDSSNSEEISATETEETPATETETEEIPATETETETETTEETQEDVGSKPRARSRKSKGILKVDVTADTKNNDGKVTLEITENA